MSGFGSESNLPKWSKLIAALRDDVRGSTAVEYTLIAAFIGGAISAAVFALGGNVTVLYESVAAIWSD